EREVRQTRAVCAVAEPRDELRFRHVQEQAEAARPEEVAARAPQDRPAPRSEDDAGTGDHALERLGLEPAERGFAAVTEEVADRPAVRELDLAVEVEERAAQLGGETRAEHRLAAAAEADERDAVARSRAAVANPVAASDRGPRLGHAPHS